MTITVKWGRERLHIPCPEPQTTLGQLRSALAEQTHLPPGSFKLIHSGAIMKDDSQPISAYGLKSGSKITIVGGSTTPPGPPSASSKPPTTETAVISTIQNELDKVRSQLLSPVNEFINKLTVEDGKSKKSNESLQQEHTRLGEMLLQSLLRLDAITPDSQWEKARAERKSAVKEVQGLLDKLDSGWRSAV